MWEIVESKLMKNDLGYRIEIKEVFIIKNKETDEIRTVDKNGLYELGIW